MERMEQAVKMEMFWVVDQKVKPSTDDYIHIEKRRKELSGLGNGKMIKTAGE